MLALLVVDARGSERAIELHGGNGVVLVDDGNDAELKQRMQGRAEVRVADGIAEVVFREKHLRDAATEAIERIVVERHETRLADGRAGLHLLESLGTLVEAKAFRAETDGAGADDEDVGAAAA